MEELWKGAKEFLAEVFAHRERQKRSYLQSFRERADFTSILPDENLRKSQVLFHMRNVRQ